MHHSPPTASRTSLRASLRASAGALSVAVLCGVAVACSGDKDSSGAVVEDSAGTTDETGDPVGGQVVWSEAFDTTSTGALSGVWGIAPDDVWIVGGVPEQGESYHWDGSTWTEVAVPEGVGLLVWVYGFASDDVWAVGVDGAGAHWDGSTWSTVDFGTTEDLWGVFGFTADDIWIVGGNADEGEPLVIRTDGVTHTVVPITPEENPRDAKTLFKVWGIDDQLFITGQTGTLLKWDGTDWRFQSGGADANQDFIGIWGTSGDHVVAVGGRGNGRISTWNGSEWVTESPTGLGGLSGVAMVSPTEAVVGGVNGYVGLYDPTTGALTDEGFLSFDDIHATWYDGAGTTWAVGGSFLAPYTGVAFRRQVED